MHRIIKMLKQDIVKMSNKEYDFVHKTVKPQNKLNDRLSEHKQFMAKVHTDHTAHFQMRENQLKTEADAYREQPQHELEANKHEISMAQAQVKAHNHHLQEIADPHEILFKKDLEQYMQEANE